MLSTVTSKGQVTVPKDIRERFSIEPGTKLDFKPNDDGTFSVRPLKRSALSIAGVLKRSKRAPVSVEQMNKAVVDMAAGRFLRSGKK
ncbi:MAG: AbrB/MazE/SpoVT family DNA-binding domain-containing protein [Gammaproteobacteria bacterium]|nr:AbrB/MazE/SpoVT family DNA-binding domain-containing protein [Gammaproteobacteria bacterium]